MPHGDRDGSQMPEDPGAMTRAELLAYAEVFAGEILRWKVWYMRDKGPDCLAEAQAIQALSAALAALLAGTPRSRACTRDEFASVASFLGYTLQDTSPEEHLARNYSQQKPEEREDADFLRAYRLRMPDDDQPRA
jgi:hypothetical protein